MGGKHGLQQVASAGPAYQAPDPPHAAGNGYAQVVALAVNGNTDPAQVAAVIEQYPEDKVRIVEFLQQQLGNGFTQKVLEVVSHSPPGGANLAAHGAFAHWGEHPTGFDFIDSGGQGLCAPGAAGVGGAGCFLSKEQRTALNSQAASNVGLVAKNYDSALTQLKLETLIKKVDELPWYASLFLGAAIAVVESLVPLGIAAFAAAGVVESAVAKAGVQLAATELTAAEKQMKTLVAGQVSSVIKSAATLGKTAAIKSFTAASSDQTQQANDKVQAMSYADTLGANANMMWLKIGHDIGSVDDATALGIWKAMDPMTMSAAQFHTQLSDQLARYAKSDISKLGREVDYENGKMVERETRVGRLIPFHGPARLVYMDRVFDGWYRDITKRNTEKTERSGVYDDSRNAFSLSQEADWKIDGKDQRHHEEPLRPDKILNYVEPEFEELALQKQKDVWLTDVETFRESFVNGQYHLTKVAGA